MTPAPCSAMERVILLIAGNHRQAQDYIRRSGIVPRRFRCLRERTDVRGYHAERVERIVRTGEYWRNPMHADDVVLALESELMTTRADCHPPYDDCHGEQASCSQCGMTKESHP